jgi:HSP20 family protein
MLIRTDPFQVFDQLSRQLIETGTRPSVMPMDAYRSGDEFLVAFDLPGIDPGSIDVSVERNVVTVTAERRPVGVGDGVQVQISERPHGVFSRELFLGENLDTEHVEASYTDGVLKLRIPVAEQAKPRKIEITDGSRQQLSA